MLYIFISFSICASQIPMNTLHKVSTSSSSSTFSGQLPIDSSYYKAICTCSTDLTPTSLNCHPTKIKLSEDIPGPPQLYSDLSSLLSSHNFSYIKSWGQPLKCLDGRDNQVGISVPGGDIGEFALALLVYQDISGAQLDYELVKSILVEWLQVMDAEYFYMCTDESAIKHIGKQIGADFNIGKPRRELVEELLKVVSNVGNIGDSHLRLMIEYPQMYSIKPEVVKHLITAFYEILWNNEKGLEKLLKVEVLEGEHTEVAYLEIRDSEECVYEGISPLLPKKIKLFINYIDAVSPRRKQLAEFFAVKIAKNHNGITSEKIYKRMNHHGLLFLDITGSFIAKKLPFYTAVFL